MGFVNIAALRAYIDANIDTNGNRGISGAELNEALNGVLDFIKDENTLYFNLTNDVTYVQHNNLKTATRVKVYSSTRLPDNDQLGSSVPDGYTFDSAMGRINFGGVRGAGELIIVDYY